MRLYALERVLAVEESEPFIAARLKAANRSAASRKGAATQREALISEANAMTIEVVELPAAEVLPLAIRHYNERSAIRDRDMLKERAGPDSDPRFLSRIAVNFIRHRLTSYDATFEVIANRIGVREATRIIRQRVFEAIAKSYPQYYHECRDQAAR